MDSWGQGGDLYNMAKAGRPSWDPLWPRALGLWNKDCEHVDWLALSLKPSMAVPQPGYGLG